MYQPVIWTQELLLQLRQVPLNVFDIYQSLNLNDVERCTIDRLAIIIEDIRQLGLMRASVADLGCSGGFLSVGLAVSVAAHVTAVDDERYIAVQGESLESSLAQFRARLDRLGIQNVSVAEQAIESFLAEQADRGYGYDIVLLLNILHHFRTGYGQQSLVGKLNPDEFIELLKHLGKITRQALYLETNALYFPNYEDLLLDILLHGEFAHLTYLGFSLAVDGSRRILWRFDKCK